MCTLPSTNAPKEFTIWWFLLVFKTTRATVRLYKSLHRRSAPSFICCSVHLASTSAYGTCPQHSICALGHKSSRRHCVTSPGDQRSHLHGQPQPPARTAFHSGQHHDGQLRWEVFPYLFGQLQGEFLLHPLLASFCLSLRAPSIIVMAIFTWLSRYTVFRFSRFLAWMPLPFLLPLLRL